MQFTGHRYVVGQHLQDCYGDGDPITVIKQVTDPDDPEYLAACKWYEQTFGEPVREQETPVRVIGPVYLVKWGPGDCSSVAREDDPAMPFLESEMVDPVDLEAF